MSNIRFPGICQDEMKVELVHVFKAKIVCQFRFPCHSHNDTNNIIKINSGLHLNFDFEIDNGVCVKIEKQNKEEVIRT